MRANKITVIPARLVCSNKAIEPPQFEPNFAAICKECSAGTLNNRAIPHFAVIETDEAFIIQCKSCGSTHVDAVAL